MPFAIRAPPNPQLSESETLHRLAEAGRNLDSVVQQRAASLAFGNVYNNFYNLVIGLRGEEVLELITHAFRRMSLTRRRLAYRVAVSIVNDTAMYLDQAWLRRLERPSLLNVAEAMYERPVARRWRRALAFAKWTVRLRVWRMAFDEVYLAPGNAGALRAEEHFRECAEREPAKRVRV